MVTENTLKNFPFIYLISTPNMKLYHGTARALGVAIEKEGLSPIGCETVPQKFRKSCYSEPDYVYFYDTPDLARIFGCGVVEKVGIGTLSQTFETDDKKVPVEIDLLLPEHSWKHRGVIPPELLTTFEIFDCKKQRKLEEVI